MHILGDRYLGMLSADGTQLQVFDINSGHMSCCGVGKFVHRTMKCMHWEADWQKASCWDDGLCLRRSDGQVWLHELQTSKEKTVTTKRTKTVLQHRHVQCWWKPVPPLRGHGTGGRAVVWAVVQTMTRCFMHATIQTTCDNSERVIPGMNAVKEVKR